MWSHLLSQKGSNYFYFRPDYDGDGYSDIVYSLDELKNQLKNSKNEIEKFKVEVKRLKADAHHKQSEI